MRRVLVCLADDTIMEDGHSQILVERLATHFGFSGGVAFRDRSRALEAFLKTVGVKGKKVALSPLVEPFYLFGVAEAGAAPLFFDAPLWERQKTLWEEEGKSQIADECVAAIFDNPLGSDLLPSFSKEVAVLEEASLSLANPEKKSDYLLISLEKRSLLSAAGGAVLLAKSQEANACLKEVSRQYDASVFLPNLLAILALEKWKELCSLTEIRQKRGEEMALSLSIGEHRPFLLKKGAWFKGATFPILLEGNTTDVLSYVRESGVEGELIFGQERSWLPKYPALYSLSKRLVQLPLASIISDEEADKVCRVISTIP